MLLPHCLMLPTVHRVRATVSLSNGADLIPSQQAPLLDARGDSSAATQPPTSTASAPASDQSQSSPNAAPLPNPWAGPGATPSSNAPAPGLPAGMPGNQSSGDPWYRVAWSRPTSFNPKP